MFVSGAEQRRRERPDLYRKLLDGPQDAQLVELIKIGPLLRLSLICFTHRWLGRVLRHENLLSGIIEGRRRGTVRHGRAS